MTPTRVTGLKLGPTYTSGGASQPWCSITYDEPLGRNTVPILDAFADAGMRGTFFTIGRQIAAESSLAELILAGGHEIGNHSWNHSRLPKLGDHGYHQLSLTQETMASILGFTPGTFRPPYGSLDTYVVANATELGLATVKWNVSAKTTEPDPANITSQVLEYVAQGSIVALHQLASHTQALPDILAGLTRRGLASVPVAQLLGGALV